MSESIKLIQKVSERELVSERETERDIVYRLM